MNILDHFTFENVGSRIEDLETPVPLIDIGIVEHNLKKWQARSDKLGIANWPHIKTHKLVALAKAQIELGARGITRARFLDVLARCCDLPPAPDAWRLAGRAP